ncbi:MAG: hypothetical protein AAFU61_15125, partial [Pseudomonadota bacterium]
MDREGRQRHRQGQQAQRVAERLAQRMAPRDRGDQPGVAHQPGGGAEAGADQADVARPSPLAQPGVHDALRRSAQRRHQHVARRQIGLQIQPLRRRMVGPHQADQRLLVELALHQPLGRVDHGAEGQGQAV